MFKLLLPQFHPQLHKLLNPHARLHILQLLPMLKLRTGILSSQQLLHSLQHGSQLLQTVLPAQFQHHLPTLSTRILPRYTIYMHGLQLHPPILHSLRQFIGLYRMSARLCQ